MIKGTGLYGCVMETEKVSLMDQRENRKAGVREPSSLLELEGHSNEPNAEKTNICGHCETIQRGEMMEILWQGSLQQINALPGPGLAVGLHLFAVTLGCGRLGLLWVSSVPEFLLPPSSTFINPGIFETQPRSSPGFDFLVMWSFVLGNCSFQKP